MSGSSAMRARAESWELCKNATTGHSAVPAEVLVNVHTSVPPTGTNPGQTSENGP